MNRDRTTRIDTTHAHPARIYNYWLGGKGHFAADREAGQQAIAASPRIVAIPDHDYPREIVGALLDAVPPGSYLLLAHPASDVRPAEIAEMMNRVNQRISGPQAMARDRAAVSRFFVRLDLLEPGVVQPQQWRPNPGQPGPAEVAAWCGAAVKT